MAYERVKTMEQMCEYRGQCGGCSGVTRPYDETLKRKQSEMESLLGDISSVEKIIAAVHPLHYRCKVHRVISRDRKGNFHSGNYRAGSHYVVDTQHCLIEDEKAQRIIETILKLIRSFRLQAYNEELETGLFRHVMIRKGYATGEIMVILVMTASIFPGKKNFVKALKEAHPEITTIVLNLNRKRTTMVLGEENQTLSGPGYIRDRLCGMTFRLSPNAFYQINPEQTEVLYRTAISYAGLTGKEYVIDAYCGTGTIGLTAASEAGHIIGIELNISSVRDARNNAKENGIRNAEFVQGDAGAIMMQMAKAGKRADVVLMDPPRSGSTEEFLRACVQLAPDRIVYVSCGPDSLKRDLLWLMGHGYRVQRIQPVDMFPYTEHVETVTLLTRMKSENLL